MDLFVTTLNQMIYLFAFILIGYLLARFGVVKPDAAGVLSKLENMLFIPALVMGTFMKNFTVGTIQSAWKLLLFSLVIEVIVLPLAILCGRKLGKGTDEQNIIIYGLAFSNFGFMGNAVVSAVFPKYFMEYVIFCLILWVFIYGWAVPALLIPKTGKLSIGQRLKNFCNPMFIGMILGMVISLTGLKLPTSLVLVIDTAGNCMSPIAMILTGITVASINIKKAFSALNIYTVTAVRLLVFPLVALGIFALLPLPETFVICAFCAMAMPLGLSPVVIPAGYGKDTSKAAAMVLVSHLLSMVTIPLLFLLMQKVI